MNIRDILLSQKTGLPIGDMQSIIFAKATGGGGGGGDFATDSWATIQANVLAGKGDAVYGNQIGATRTITLSDNTEFTLRLVNTSGNLYERVGGGYTGFIVEFADLVGKSQWATVYNVSGGWKDKCLIRSDFVPGFITKLPSDLNDVLATVKVGGLKGDMGSTTIQYSDDKLFVPSEAEYKGNTPTEPFPIWAYYNDGDASKRIKNYTGNPANYWTRTPVVSGSSGKARGITRDGEGAAYDAPTNMCFSLAFCI